MYNVGVRIKEDMKAGDLIEWEHYADGTRKVGVLVKLGAPIRFGQRTCWVRYDGEIYTPVLEGYAKVANESR